MDENDLGPDLPRNQVHKRIRALVKATPPLSDLPMWWVLYGMAAEEVGDTDGEDYQHKHKLLLFYRHFAFRKRWAWDGLHILLEHLQEWGEPIPVALKDFAVTVAIRRFNGSLKAPRKPANPRFAPRLRRDMGIMRLLKLMRRGGWTHEKALLEIGEALEMQEDTVRSVYRRMKKRFPGWSV